MKKCFTLFLATFVAVAFANAQTVLQGQVNDAHGEPVIGASVYLKGSTLGTTTTIDGTFELAVESIPENDILVFSIIGYIPQEFVIGKRTRFDVVMQEDITTLSEIVVTGYTTQEKEKITGAVSTVNAETLNKLPVASIDQALQGRAAGVVVSQNTGAPGEGVSVRIRGVGSINSGNAPLYIVDGIPTLDITSVSMQDVDNISILRDASATALYGARATNGVVIITTKSGADGASKIQVNSQVGFQQPSRLIKMANTAQYRSIYNEATIADNATKPNPLFHRPLITDEIAATLSDVDHVDAILQSGVLQTHSLSISGGDAKTKYFISGNYFGQEGLIKSSNYTRITGRANVDSQIKDWLKVGVNLNVSRAKTDLIGSSGDGAGGNGGSVIRYAFFRTPGIPVYDAQGEFTDMPEYYRQLGDGYNPVGMLAYNQNELAQDRLFGKFFIEIEPLKDLKFTSNMGVDVLNSNQRRFDRTWGTGNRINNINRLLVNDFRTQDVTFSNFLTYTKLIGDHTLSFLLGTESIKTDRAYFSGTQKDFPDQDGSLVFLGNGLGIMENSEAKSGSALASFYGKVDYDYANGKYIASATLRRDGSSRFGPDNRWGTFYAGSLGWRLDKENFLMDNDVFDLIKLRVGYGSIGNQEIGDYRYTDQIQGGYNYALGGIRTFGYAVNLLGNSELKWESSQQFNAGIDLAIAGKWTLSFDFFNKITSDLLVARPLPTSSGTAVPPIVNDGEILNRGFELAVAYSNQIGDFKYSIAANAATLHNEVLALKSPIRQGLVGSDFLTFTEVGHPVGSFYLYEMEGIFQDEAEIFTSALPVKVVKPGDVKYKDQDENGTINADDRKHVGSAIPKITAALTVNLNYKNFDLSMFFQGAYGHKIFSVLNRDIEGFYRGFNVTERYYNNHWTGPGTTNQFPRASWDASGNNNIVYSDRFLEDGSYTRLKNLQVGYTFPRSLLDNYGFSSVRIYFSGTNLLTFTKYHGLDPEMTVSDNASGGGDKASGIDWGTYPSARSYNIGVNLTF
ncbi:MAG TPA: TonB-dependent receptor [Ohtaekwangia sp.]|nr:TonB-dependent receptor [Ohtaekwangia sp.]